jgi:hypothetical protein
MTYSRRCRSALIVAVVVAASAPISAQLVADDVIYALEAGRTNKFTHLVFSCKASPGMGQNMATALLSGQVLTGSFTVTMSGPMGRIATASREAARLYQTFARSDVEMKELSTAGFFVAVEPHAPNPDNNVVHVAAPIQTVVLKAKKAGDVAQPLGIEITPGQFTNLVGGTVHVNRALARFPQAWVQALPGDIEVVVVTTAGERKCSIGQRQREQLYKRR